MRTPLVAANWKMFKTVHEAVVYTKELRSLVKDIDNVEIVMAPPFTALHAVAEAARNTNIGVAGQDLFWEREGAFTGEISGAMLKEAGAAYDIIGHSERRTKFGETDEAVNRKTLAAFVEDLTPIVCIGETLAEREGGQTLAVLDRQIRQGLAGLRAEQVESLAIAYEPVWAIGTGRTATAAQAQEAHAHSRARLGGGSARPPPHTATLFTGAV
jgi:triosephosphate isomerase